MSAAEHPAPAHLANGSDGDDSGGADAETDPRGPEIDDSPLRAALLAAKGIGYSASESGKYYTTELVQRLGLPLMRAGFPQYDLVGGYARTWVGYRGSRQALFDLANLMLSQHHELEPYRSVYWNESRDAGGSFERHDTPSAATGLVH